MKYLLIGLSILLLIGCGSTGQVKPLGKFSVSPRFLISGQSNAVSPAQSHAPYYSQTGLVAITDIYGGRGLRVPTQADTIDSGIAWIYLGDMMNRSVTFDNIARGNTSTRVWKNELFNDRMAPALLANDYDAILWVQGESDIGEHFSGEETYQNLKWLILESRKIKPDVEWYIALNSAKTTPRENSVRIAEKRIISEGLAHQGPDTDAMRENPDWMETTFGEFVGEGLEEHGRLWYEILKDRF